MSTVSLRVVHRSESVPCSNLAGDGAGAEFQLHICQVQTGHYANSLRLACFLALKGSIKLHGFLFFWYFKHFWSFNLLSSDYISLIPLQVHNCLQYATNQNKTASPPCATARGMQCACFAHRWGRQCHYCRPTEASAGHIQWATRLHIALWEALNINVN